MHMQVKALYSRYKVRVMCCYVHYGFVIGKIPKKALSKVKPHSVLVEVFYIDAKF